MNTFLWWVGALTVGAVALALLAAAWAVAIDRTLRSYRLTMWVVQFVMHRKAFRQWVAATKPGLGKVWDKWDEPKA